MKKRSVQVEKLVWFPVFQRPKFFAQTCPSSPKSSAPKLSRGWKWPISVQLFGAKSSILPLIRHNVFTAFKVSYVIWFLDIFDETFVDFTQYVFVLVDLVFRHCCRLSIITFEGFVQWTSIEIRKCWCTNMWKWRNNLYFQIWLEFGKITLWASILN